MKKLFILLAALLPLSLFAQELKIAYVDAQSVLFALPEIPNIQKQIEDESNRYENELTVMQEEYTKKANDYVAQQEELTENIKLRRMQEIQDIQDRIENFYPVAQRDLQQLQQTLMQPLQERVAKAIQEVGDEKGYTYIMIYDPQLFLYVGNSAIDATPFVRQKLGL